MKKSALPLLLGLSALSLCSCHLSLGFLNPSTDPAQNPGGQGYDQGTYYHVSFDDRMGNYQSTSVREGDTIPYPKEPWNPDHPFRYWADISNNREWDFGTPVYRDVDLYAVYDGNGSTPSTHTVTFVDDLYGYVVFAEYQVMDGESSPYPGDPYHEGYRFLGWHEDGASLWDFGRPIYSDMKFFAQWAEEKEETVFVTFDDGHGGIFAQWVGNKGDKVEYPDEPSWEGHRFIGWATPWGEYWNFSNSIYEDLYLYAQWMQDDGKTVLVTFDDGHGGIFSQWEINTGETIYSPGEPYWEGHRFIGWATQWGEYWNFGTAVYEDLYLIAQWVEDDGKTVLVTFDDGNGGIFTQWEINRGEIIGYPGDPYWEGHTFLGWATEGGEYWNFSTPVLEDLYLIAQWKEGTGAVWNCYQAYFEEKGNDLYLVYVFEFLDLSYDEFLALNMTFDYETNTAFDTGQYQILKKQSGQEMRNNFEQLDEHRAIYPVKVSDMPDGHYINHLGLDQGGGGLGPNYNPEKFDTFEYTFQGRKYQTVYYGPEYFDAEHYWGDIGLIIQPV